MDIRIDRDIPVPITAQIKGQIEYGVTYGTIERGSRLPNVRTLARELHVSPVTVSQAYKDLRELGIVNSAPGRGTYVSETLPAKVATADRFAALDQALDALVDQARELGVERQDLLLLVGQRMSGDNPPNALNLAFVGIYREPSEHYVRGIRRYLGTHDRIDVVTFDALQGIGSERPLIEGRDALLTFGHRIADLEALAPEGTPILPVPVIPAEETRTALAAVEPLARVGLVAAFPEFLAVMSKGVATFAPHATVEGAVLDGMDEAASIGDRCDVVVYASGCRLGPKLQASRAALIEYLHTPDPAYLVRTLAPELARLRNATTAPDGADH